MDFPDLTVLADLVALKPASYITRIVGGVGAFYAAMNIEGVVSRVIGLAILLAVGLGLLVAGVGNGTIVDILLGIISLAAAAYAWWHTRT